MFLKKVGLYVSRCRHEYDECGSLCFLISNVIYCRAETAHLSPMCVSVCVNPGCISATVISVGSR